MHRRLLIAVVALVAAADVASAAAPTGSAGAVQRGLRLAERNCAVCHAIGARGASPNKAAPPFPTLHRRYPAETLDEAFRKGLLSGHPAMPEFRFRPDELTDLTAYLRSLRSRGQTEARAGVVLRAAY